MPQDLREHHSVGPQAQEWPHRSNNQSQPQDQRPHHFLDGTRNIPSNLCSLGNVHHQNQTQPHTQNHGGPGISNLEAMILANAPHEHLIAAGNPAYLHLWNQFLALDNYVQCSIETAESLRRQIQMQNHPSFAPLEDQDMDSSPVVPGPMHAPPPIPTPNSLPDRNPSQNNTNSLNPSPNSLTFASNAAFSSVAAPASASSRPESRCSPIARLMSPFDHPQERQGGGGRAPFTSMPLGQSQSHSDAQTRSQTPASESDPKPKTTPTKKSVGPSKKPKAKSTAAATPKKTSSKKAGFKPPKLVGTANKVKVPRSSKSASSSSSLPPRSQSQSKQAASESVSTSPDSDTNPKSKLDPDDYPHIKYWYEHRFHNARRDAQAKSTDFLEHEDGEFFTLQERVQVYAEASTYWESIAAEAGGEDGDGVDLVPCFRDASAKMMEGFVGRLEGAFPVLAMCEAGWKSKRVWIHQFKQWKQNMRSKRKKAVADGVAVGDGEGQGDEKNGPGDEKKGQEDGSKGDDDEVVCVESKKSVVED
ncbi:hypothetical protein PQX77_004540 [Marasmius sp. AFHP31]|nr:hypothetical protein PQX77_004540 [Marasmius sp. AFHP31]